MKMRNKKITSLLLIILLISTLLITTGCGKNDGGKDKVFKWKLQSSYGPGDQTWDIQMPMIVDAIEKETDGKIKIKTYTPGSICEPEQAPASVENGMLDCALSTAGDTGQTIPAAYAEQGIPFFWEDQEDMYETYYKYGLLEFLRKHYKEHNIYYGMPVPNGVYSLMTNFPVKKASDLKGRKIRSYSSWGQFVKNLGGSPVNIPGGDIYMAMKLGTVDGCLFTFAELYNAKLSEVTDYVMEQPASGSGFVSFIISKKAWDELPKDLQKAVNKALKDCYHPIMKKCIAYDKKARKHAKKKGVKFIKISEENMETFWKAGENTAKQVEKQYPEAKEGINIVRKWHKEKEK